jgi:hypothetical protein
MSEEQNHQNEPKKEFVLDEFLIKTIVSLQSTLATIEKDSDQKTDLLHDLADSMTAVTYNMKEAKDKLEKTSDNQFKVLESILRIKSHIDLVDAKFESENAQTIEHLKEIKYAVQQFEKKLIELKNAEVEKKKKSDIGTMIDGIWEALKNVRIIFIILLILALIFSVLVGGHSAIGEILKAISGFMN